jgi:hypothetical protein
VAGPALSTVSGYGGAMPTKWRESAGERCYGGWPRKGEVIQERDARDWDGVAADSGREEVRIFGMIRESIGWPARVEVSGHFRNDDRLTC